LEKISQARQLRKVKPLTAEWLALQFLKYWTVEDIQIAIEKKIDLQELIVDNPDEAIPLSGSARLFDLSWTVGDILFWFSQRRPDLYNALATEEGIQWIINHHLQRDKIKETLTGNT